MDKLTILLCRIFGHRWDTFTAEQCPEVYRVCERCDAIEHVCNNIRATQGSPTNATD